MRIKELTLQTFGCHANRKFEFPETGVVLITGPNGSGKSSIVEALAAAVWNKTLRGEPLWNDGLGELNLETYDDLRVTRVRTKSANRLNWCVLGTEEAEYDTVTKAQEALDCVVGEFEHWRTSLVFTSSDSASFAECTDVTRKRMLEDVLGMTKLALAHANCKVAAKDAEQTSATSDYKVKELAEETEHLHDQLEAIIDVQHSKRAELVKQEETLREELDKLSSRMKRLAKSPNLLKPSRDKLSILNSRNKQIANRLSAMHAGMNVPCELCGQVITKQHVLAEIARLEPEVKQITKEIEEVKQATMLLEAAAKDYEQARIDHGNCTGRLSQVKLALNHATDDAVTRMQLQIADSYQEFKDMQQKAEDDEHEYEVLAVAERVLSPRGVRALLLSNALGYMEEIANYWLERVTRKPLSLILKPYTVNADGAQTEVMSMKVVGAGGGHGYWAASGGERRRINIALMLSLSELQELTAMSKGGTMFFDEVFDALDNDGVQAVVDVLEELSRSRCVVVISHNDSLVQGLRNVVQHVRL